MVRVQECCRWGANEATVCHALWIMSAPASGASRLLTMYGGQTQLLVANPLKRYVPNSTMLASFKFADDGSLTL